MNAKLFLWIGMVGSARGADWTPQRGVPTAGAGRLDAAARRPYQFKDEGEV